MSIPATSELADLILRAARRLRAAHAAALDGLLSDDALAAAFAAPPLPSRGLGDVVGIPQ